jgi:uncharacterized protein YbjT (DUF2867 family)
MKILLTGATGYIGKRLLPVLVSKGHRVVCCVRDKGRFDVSEFDPLYVSVVEVNFLDEDSLENIPEDIEVAYYLIHSMSTSISDFERLERISAENFRNRLDHTKVRQVIYLSGIVNEEKLSRHLSSRKAVEEILAEGSYHLTTLRAGIIVGSGSASFEIIRDLIEKLPFMVAPLWLNTRAQPIAIRNVVQFLTGVILHPETFDKSFDIGGPEILTYREMLMQFASSRKLKRTIKVVRVMTPRLSSYWLYFITSTSYRLAANLVNSMKVEVVCQENDLKDLLKIDLLTYKESIEMAFDRIKQQEVISSWTDALSSHTLEEGIAGLVQIPSHGCYTHRRDRAIRDEDKILDRIWAIGGKQGWYYATWLWELRGFLDKLAGGVGLRRGRKSRAELSAGDSLDFWRVLLASRKEKRLLLYGEMIIPGEAWLEFRINEGKLYQTATFRPLGVWGRWYWYALMPFHTIIFRGMIKRIARIGI